MRISHSSVSRLALVASAALFSTSVTALSQERCEGYDSLRAYLETAHKMRETARAMQVFPDRKPDASLRFFRNHDTGLWAVMRIDPPNCARVIVTGYGWEDTEGAAL